MPLGRLTVGLTLIEMMTLMWKVWVLLISVGEVHLKKILRKKLKGVLNRIECLKAMCY